MNAALPLFTLGLLCCLVSCYGWDKCPDNRRDGAIQLHRCRVEAFGAIFGSSGKPEKGTPEYKEKQCRYDLEARTCMVRLHNLCLDVDWYKGAERKAIEGAIAAKEADLAKCREK